MQRLIAVILFTLFNLGVFGVSIERHLCCHSQQEDSTLNHCNDDESCCGENEDCCDEIVSQVKIAKDYTSQNFKLDFPVDNFILSKKIIFNCKPTAEIIDNKISYSASCYFPPPKNFQISFSSFLI